MLRNLAKDSAIYGGADLATKIIAFFTFPLIAAALSPEAYGSLELIITVTALLGLVMNCGLNNSVQRYYWDKDTKEVQRPIIVTTGLAAQMLFGVLTIVIGALALYALYPYIKVLQLPLTWIALVAALVFMVVNQWLQYTLDVTRLHLAPWRFMTISTLARVASALLALYVVVFLDCGLDGMLTVQALIVIAVLPLALFFIRKDLLLKIDREWFSELVIFGYPFIFAGIAYWLFGSMDRWMLVAFSSIEEVGVYSVSFRFASIVLFVSIAFGQAWSPIAVKIRTDRPEAYRSIYANVLLLILFVMLIVSASLALFSGELIGLIMPNEYAGSALPLSILCFGIVLQATQQVTAVGISLEKKTFLFARLAWITALINFALNWLLIPRLGAAGAAWATTISYLVLTGSYLYYTQRLHPLPILWKNLLFIIFLGTCIFLVSVNYVSMKLDWPIIAIKLLLALTCIILAWLVLPVKRLQYN